MRKIPYLFWKRGEVILITLNMKLNEIMHIPEFEGYGKFIFPWPEEEIVNVRLRNIDAACPASVIQEGLEYLRKLRKEDKCEFIRLYDREDIKKDPSKKDCLLMTFLLEKEAPVVVLCPGGGYQCVCSFVEGFPVAKRLNELGYHVVIVNYRCKEAAVVPNPMDDLGSAVRYIMNHAIEWKINSQYALMGFSAGGHLAASFGVKMFGYERYGLPKPVCMILGYPVITMGKFAHEGSKNTLAGSNCTKMEKFVQMYSVEENITHDYPASYIWQCSKDDTVPIENTEKMAEKLSQYGVVYKYRTYNSKVHGLGLGKGTIAEGWLDEAVRFWKEIQQTSGE